MSGAGVGIGNTDESDDDDDVEKKGSGEAMSVTDVAARAGVSIATVSRVLNNSRRVNPQIAEQVRKAIVELNYSPQRMRRRNGAREGDIVEGTLAVVCVGQNSRGWLQVPVIAAAVAAVSKAAEGQGLAVTITELLAPDAVNPILRRKDVLGALALMPGVPDKAASDQIVRMLPTVRIMGGQLAPTEIDHVTTDNNAVGYMAAGHLVEHGCKRLAFVTSAPSWQFLRLRRAGFRAAADDAGVFCHIPDHTRLPITYEDYVSLSAQLDQIVDLKVDGVFVSRDEEAVELYRLMATRGIVPGRDLRIISCDNDPVRLGALSPRPVSIELGLEEIAQHAVRRLIWRAKHPKAPPVRILVRPQIAFPGESRSLDR